MSSFTRAWILLLLLVAGGCSAWVDRPWVDKKSTDLAATPVYNRETGRLERLESDRNSDGKIDTTAVFEGKRLVRVDIDRNFDGRMDRWEHYSEKAASAPGASTAAEITRADDADGADDRITRSEFYERGVLRRVEEDTDGNGRIDKWEYYENGAATKLELDMKGEGFPDRRMVLGRNGEIERTEVDSDGRGNWRPVPPMGR